MSARCASCRYPLTVSDSVVCRECLSYFHIDCAQLVGFPVFVLSGEPGKNTFHCSTCQLLPLPVERDDSSDDEGMPSRQLDLALEGDTDIAKEMNEMKGGIQDLSDLCKDMLREINDLKSINLTLRCCVENLRHDNEQRDAVISELKLRIDQLEGKYFGKIRTDCTLDQSREEKESERCTPNELECSKTTSGNLVQSLKYDSKSLENLENSSTLPKKSSTFYESKEEIISEKENEDLDTDFYLNENKLNEDTDTEYSGCKSIDEDEQVKEQELVTNKEEMNAEIESKQDWSWRGNKAVELEREENSNEEEEGSEAETDVEDKDSQSWQKLEVEVETLSKEEDIIAESVSEDDFWELHEDDKSEENKELGRVRKSVRWDEGVADNESESEADWSQKETNESEEIVEQNNEEPSEVSEGKEEPRDHEGLPSEGDVAGDLEDRLEPKKELQEEVTEAAQSELLVGEDRLEMKDGEPGVLEHIEGLPDGESRLEEGGREVLSTGEEGLHLEGEMDDSRESRQDIPELSVDEVQPPESPPVVHTEEDLWMFLRDSVSSEHPSTVQEFVENLIGTLQHVPEEYLRPVIDANIRRVKTPSVTDGEHLSAPEDGEVMDENFKEKLGPLEGENLSSMEAQDSLRSEEVLTSATEVTSQFSTSSAFEAAD